MYYRLYLGLVLKQPSFKVYNQIREESEYAGWLYVYGFRANHFTVSINHLQDYESIQSVNQLLKDNGFKLNTSGGEVKGSPEALLVELHSCRIVFYISKVLMSCLDV